MRNRSSFADGLWTPTARCPRRCATFRSVSSVSAMCSAKPERWPLRRLPMRNRSSFVYGFWTPTGRRPRRCATFRSVSTDSAMYSAKPDRVAVATASHEESLAHRRRHVDAYRETPQALRDLSISLNRLGDARRDTGVLPDAVVAYEESLSLDRRLLEVYGETPQALRDLSIILERLGSVRREAGDVDAAAVDYEEALALRRIAVMKHRQPHRQVLQELLATVRTLEDIAVQNGDDVARGLFKQERQAVEIRLAAMKL